MGYLCNAESAIATCDSYNWDKNKTILTPNKNLIRKKNKKLSSTLHPIILRCFPFGEIEIATNGFSPRSLLGKGSHGSVFRAAFDSGDLVAAVKRSINSAVISAAENEIQILSKIHSRRIVNLIGYSILDKAIYIVVEYMPNGSLYDHIHKIPKPPGWSNRVRFALQIAKAVQTLHGLNPPVIHRDIKSSNVLLDEKKNARLSDFGLAMRGQVEDMRVMSTPPAGTLGYLDPCYLAPSDLSAKSDVFSFGILLIEIISGRRAIDVNYSPPSIVDWALPLIKSRSYRNLCDRRIGWTIDPTVVKELAVLAARCVRSTAEKRPAMTDVVNCLEMIYKRVKAASMWSNLRRRVRHVESSSSRSLDGSDVEEHVKIKTSRHGCRKSSSTNTTTEANNSSGDIIVELMTRGRNRVGRSKSIGSFREIKVGPDVGSSTGELIGVKKRAQVTVKMSTIRLSKSRSMSVLHSKNNEMKMVNNVKNKEVDVLPLLVNFSTKAK